MSKHLRFLSAVGALALGAILVTPVTTATTAVAAPCVENPQITITPTEVPKNGGMVTVKATGFCMTEDDFGIMTSIAPADTEKFNDEGGVNGLNAVNQMVPKATITDGAFTVTLRAPRFKEGTDYAFRTMSWSKTSANFGSENESGSRYTLKQKLTYEGTSTPPPAPTCVSNPTVTTTPAKVPVTGGNITVQGTGFCEQTKFSSKQGVLLSLAPSTSRDFSIASSTTTGRNLIRLSTENTADNYTPDQGGEAVLKADGSFSVTMKVPAQENTETYSIFTSGGGFFSSSRDQNDGKFDISYEERTAPVVPKNPTLTVTKAPRNGGTVHISGKDYLAKYPGLYLCILPKEYATLHGNAAHCHGGDFDGVMYIHLDQTGTNGNQTQLHPDGSFDFDWSAPAYSADKEWIVSTIRAHGLAATDKSQSVSVPLEYEAAPIVPTITVTAAPRSGGEVTIKGTGFVTDGTGVQVSIATADVDAIWPANTDNWGNEEWDSFTAKFVPRDTWLYTPSSAAMAEFADEGTAFPLAADGTFTLKRTIPNFCENKNFAVLTTKSQGEGEYDNTLNTKTLIQWDADSSAPKCAEDATPEASPEDTPEASPETPTSPESPEEGETDPTKVEPKVPAADSGKLLWGLKRSWRNYIDQEGPEHTVLSEGAVFNPAGYYEFPQVSISDKDGVKTISYSGKLHYNGHGGILYVTLSDPQLRVNADGTATLWLRKWNRVAGKADTPGEFFPAVNIEGVTTGVNGVLALENATTRITPELNKVLGYGGQNGYKKNTKMANLSFTYTPATVAPGEGTNPDKGANPNEDSTNKGSSQDDSTKGSSSTEKNKDSGKRQLSATGSLAEGLVSLTLIMGVSGALLVVLSKKRKQEVTF